MTREQSALIGLLGCALRGERPEAGLLAGVDQERLYEEAGRHMVAAMTGMALEDAALPDMDAQAMERWKQAAGMGRYRRILMDREREALLAFLEEQGIWYLPLKRILLQELYPRFGMREMADNDILYDVHGREALRRFMIGRGYEASPVRMEVHDDFRKPPLYHFEMHTRLFEESFDDAIFAYYEDTARLLRPDGDRRFGRHMSEEDFFLYFLAHAYRHFAREGTGLRTLTDCALFLRAREELLDRDYLDRELRALGLTDFAHTLCGLSRKLFERPALRRVRHLGAEGGQGPAPPAAGGRGDPSRHPTPLRTAPPVPGGTADAQLQRLRAEASLGAACRLCGADRQMRSAPLEADAERAAPAAQGGEGISF